MKEREEKKRLIATLQNILYFVDEQSERTRLLEILEKYNNKLPDSKFKDLIDKFRKKFANDYYSLVDYLIDDILDGRLTPEKKRIINEMLDELQPVVNNGNRSFWDKLKDLFNWD